MRAACEAMRASVAAKRVAVCRNHDFDFGVDNMLKLNAQCKFPWLMANALDDKTGACMAHHTHTHTHAGTHARRLPGLTSDGHACYYTFILMLYTCIHTYIHTYIYIYIYTYATIHTCMLAIETGMQLGWERRALGL
jgi:hypothetical protein